MEIEQVQMAIAAFQHAKKVKQSFKNTNGPRDEDIEACPGDCDGTWCHRCWRDQ